MNSTSFSFVRTIGLLALLAPATFAQVTLTPVAISGLIAPGTGTALFDSLGGAGLNTNGEVAFYATLDGLGASDENDTGIWAGAIPAGLAAREDDRPPGTADGTEFDTLSDPMLASGGHIAFRAMLRGLGVNIENDAGIWSGLPAALQLAARKGAVPPGINNAGVKFDTFSLPAVNGSGAVAFHASIIGLTINEFNDTGIWAGTPGSLTLVARERDLPPGVDNAFIEFESFQPPAISSSGNVAFHASIRGLSVSGENDMGIWAGPANALTLAAREEARPPGTTTGVMFDSFADVVVDAGDQIAFSATLRGLGVNDQNDTGIWAGVPGSLRLVAREKDRPPGIAGNGVEFATFGPPVLSAAGQIAFRATARGLGINEENREGIWTGPITAPSLLVRAGAQAPGTSDDVDFLSFEDPVFTGAGTVAFFANLTGEVDFDDDSGIWAADTDGRLRLIVREGDSLDGGDRIREISPGGLKLFPNQGGDGLNSSGLVQVLFQASFIDGTNGLFLATLGAPSIESIVTINNDGGGVQIQFQGVAGVSYGIEFTTALAGGKWELLSGLTPGKAGPMIVTDTIRPEQKMRVYRLRLSPLR